MLAAPQAPSATKRSAIEMANMPRPCSSRRLRSSSTSSSISSSGSSGSAGFSTPMPSMSSRTFSETALAVSAALIFCSSALVPALAASVADLFLEFLDMSHLLSQGCYLACARIFWYSEAAPASASLRMCVSIAETMRLMFPAYLARRAFPPMMPKPLPAAAQAA